MAIWVVQFPREKLIQNDRFLAKHNIVEENYCE
jgi:hypothetical protein